MRYSVRRSVDPGSQEGKLIMKVFFWVGLAFVAVALLLAGLKIRQQRSYLSVDGVILRLVDGNHPVVEYTVDGTRHVQRLNVGSDSFRSGQKITLFCNPDNPDKVSVGGFLGYLAAFILGLIGLAFTLVGGITLKKYHGKKKQKEDVPIWEQ